MIADIWVNIIRDVFFSEQLLTTHTEEFTKLGKLFEVWVKSGNELEDRRAYDTALNDFLFCFTHLQKEAIKNKLARRLERAIPLIFKELK